MPLIKHYEYTIAQITCALVITACATTSSAATFYNCNNSDGCIEVSRDDQPTDYAQTTHPFMLAHGGGGYSRIIGTDYFYNIPQELTASGATVFQATLPAFQSADMRGEYLLSQMAAAQAIVQNEKFNLIGHSMGGFDARYAAGTTPAQVASLTTLSSPNRGTGVADTLKEIQSNDTGSTVVAVILDALNAVGSLLAGAQDTDMPQDSEGLLNLVNHEGAAEFNTRFPAGIVDNCDTYQQETDVNNIAYYSWSGNELTTNLLDPSDSALNLSGLLIEGDNDGLSPRCSTHLGYVIRDDYFLNHYDTVNLFFGLRSLLSPDPVSLVRVHANRLKQEGR